MVETSEKVKLVYRDGKAYFSGGKLKGVLEITQAELTNIYFGKEGSGTLHIKIED